jgi:hypothetical protein
MNLFRKILIKAFVLILFCDLTVGVNMSIEKAMIAQAPPYMVATMARDMIRKEVLKGCRSDISIEPVSLEPNFSSIWTFRNTKDLSEQPDYTIEHSISCADQIRQQIWMSPERPFDWNDSELFIKQLHTLSYRSGFEVVGNCETIMMNLLCNRLDLPVINTAFQGVFDFFELSKVTDHPFSTLPVDLWKDTCFRDYFPYPPYYNLLTRPSEIKTSPLKSLIIALSQIKAPAIGFYQALFKPVPPEHNWHRNVEILLDIEYIQKLQSGFHVPQRYSQQSPSGDLRHMAMDLEGKAHNDKPFFTMALRVGVVGGGDERENLLSSIATFTSLFQHGGRPLAFIHQGAYTFFSPDQIRRMFRQGLVHRPGFLVNSWELTGPVHMSFLDVNEHRSIPIKILEALPPPKSSIGDGTPLGIYEYAGKIYPVCIPSDIRAYSTHVIARPGQAKSTTLAFMGLNDIDKGDGLAVLDPHGDLIDVFLCLIPKKHIQKTILFDPGNPEYVLIWNIFKNLYGQDISRTADDLVAALKKIVTGWGDRLEHLMRHGFNGLLRLSDSTLLDMSNLLSPKSSESERLRKEILKVMDNPTAIQFWKNDFKQYSNEALGPPKHKLSKLLVSDNLWPMFSQTDNFIDFRQIMDQGNILLVNLSNIGSEEREILGCFILSLLRLAALSRSDIPDKDRKRFHIYVDEAHRFVHGSVDDTIAELRKFRVDGIYAHHYLSQFDKKKVDALSSVGTTIIMNLDSKDAQYLTKDLRNLIHYEDIINLKVGEAIARIGTEIIKVKLNGPLQIPEHHHKDEIIQQSLNRYYRPAHEVKQWIRQRSMRSTSTMRPLISSPPKTPDGQIKEFYYDEF